MIAPLKRQVPAETAKPKRRVRRSVRKKPEAKPERPPVQTGPLTGKQRRYLRSLGHHLEPVVQLGKQGLTDAVVAAIDEAIGQHELVKVRVGTECPDDRHEVAERLAPALKSEVAQVLGRTILLYRRHPKEPKIALPKGE
jgi:RNA-binding protein